MGNVFVLRNKPVGVNTTVGLGSIHFEAFDNIYISYAAFPAKEVYHGKMENVKLDNGNPIPAKKQFTNTRFPAAHNFTGEIDWATPEGTSRHGQKKKVYRFHVDEHWIGSPTGAWFSCSAASSGS